MKGNKEIRPVMKLEISQTNAKSINWNNFDEKNFSKVADTYWESEVFK